MVLALATLLRPSWVGVRVGVRVRVEVRVRVRVRVRLGLGLGLGLGFLVIHFGMEDYLVLALATLLRPSWVRVRVRFRFRFRVEVRIRVRVRVRFRVSRNSFWHGRLFGSCSCHTPQAILG